MFTFHGLRFAPFQWPIHDLGHNFLVCSFRAIHAFAGFRLRHPTVAVDADALVRWFLFDDYTLFYLFPVPILWQSAPVSVFWFENLQFRWDGIGFNEYTLIFFVFSRTHRSRRIFSAARAVSLTRWISVCNLCSWTCCWLSRRLVSAETFSHSDALSLSSCKCRNSHV